MKPEYKELSFKCSCGNIMILQSNGIYKCLNCNSKLYPTGTEGILIQENIDKFNKWYAGFIKACSAIDITKEKGYKFIDIINKTLEEY